MGPKKPTDANETWPVQGDDSSLNAGGFDAIVGATAEEASAI